MSRTSAALEIVENDPSAEGAAAPPPGAQSAPEPRLRCRCRVVEGQILFLWYAVSGPSLGQG